MPETAEKHEKDTGLSARESRLVQDAIKGVFEQLAPVLQSIALTPEKIREANKPYVDPAAIARELREREKTRKDTEEGRARTRAQQENCPHLDKNGKWAINLQHNFPDHKPRGMCPLCFIYIEPAHWDLHPPTPEFPDGEPYVIPEHRLYHIVRTLESFGK